MAANSIQRFSGSMIKHFEEAISVTQTSNLTVDLDDDFSLLGKKLFLRHNVKLNLSDILRAFYYIGLNDAYFDEPLRRLIIEYVENLDANEFVDVHHSLHVRKQTNHYLLGLQKPTRSKIYSGTWFSSRLRQCDHESLDMTLQINHDLTAAKQFGLMLKQLLRK